MLRRRLGSFRVRNHRFAPLLSSGRFCSRRKPSLCPSRYGPGHIRWQRSDRENCNWTDLPKLRTIRSGQTGSNPRRKATETSFDRESRHPPRNACLHQKPVLLRDKKRTRENDGANGSGPNPRSLHPIRPNRPRGEPSTHSRHTDREHIDTARTGGAWPLKNQANPQATHGWTLRPKASARKTAANKEPEETAFTSLTSSSLRNLFSTSGIEPIGCWAMGSPNCPRT